VVALPETNVATPASRSSSNQAEEKAYANPDAHSFMNIVRGFCVQQGLIDPSQACGRCQPKDFVQVPERLGKKALDEDGRIDEEQPLPHFAR